MESVSICIPVYNGEKYLKECLDSCLGQGAEIVVVNDGSTDGTKKILDSYKGIKVIHTENKGEGPARNTAVKNSSGDYIAIMDADDVMFPDRIKNSLNDIVGADVVYSGYLGINEYGIPLFIYNPMELNSVNFKLNQVIPNPTIMIRRDKYIPYRDYRFSPDFAFIWDLVKSGCKFKCSEDYYIKYRMNPTSLTSTTNQSVKDMYKNIVLKEMEEYGEDIWNDKKR